MGDSDDEPDAYARWPLANCLRGGQKITNKAPASAKIQIGFNVQ